MKPERWQQIDKLLQSALDQLPEQLDMYIEEACAGDSSLRRELESLIASHKQAGSFIESPACNSATVVLTEEQIKLANRSNEMIGTYIDRYKILALLGEGGMGQVYLAEDTKLERKVALKMLPADKIVSEQLLRRFEQEARAASALNHPNILIVHDIGQIGTSHYIVTEYIEGEILCQTSLKPEMTLADTLDIGIQIASALAAAHQAGIVHRDIKPRNIILRPDGVVKVIDFGIAKLIERQEPKTDNRRITSVDTEPDVVVGTPSYMSPEQARGLSLDARTDIFSFGIVLYEMITRNLPFEGATFNDVIAAILTKEPLPLISYAPGIPADLEQIIFRALRKNREDRYQRIIDLRTDLRELKERIESSESEADRTFSLIASSKQEAPNNSPSNLGVPLTGIIGRETELEALERLLRQYDVRLVTLTGPGGTGKTRLATQVASDLIKQFEGGIHFVSLAPISDTENVISAIAQTLGVRESGGRPLLLSLKEHLFNKQALLLLDNFEQVISCAPLIAELLTACTQLKVLVTSRAPLHLRGEYEFQVPPLALPDLKHLPSAEVLSQYSAVALFIQRASAIKPEFVINSENAHAVAEICTRLDGLPLAIELAAARIKLLSPQAMLARLENRLKLLTGGARDLPVRQQTIRNVIAWSYDLLNEKEKKLFRRLAVFVGGFTLEAAEAVCSLIDDSESDVFDGVASLVDKSLLKQEEKPEGDLRFLMLETIREYGLECLSDIQEESTVQQACSSFFLGLAEKAEPELLGPNQITWLRWLERDHENFQAALHWSQQSGNVEFGLKLAGALWLFWGLHGHLSRGRGWLDNLLSLSESKNVRTYVRVKALRGHGVLMLTQGDYGRAAPLLEESLAIYKELSDKQGIAASLSNLGTIFYYQANSQQSVMLLEESLALYRELEDQQGTAHVLNVLGLVVEVQGNYDRAVKLHQESLAIKRKLGEKQGIAISLNNLSAVTIAMGNYQWAKELSEESLAIFQELGDRVSIANSLDNLGNLAQYQGDYGQAKVLFTEALDIFKEVGDKRGVALSLNNLGTTAIYQGNYEHAVALLRQSITFRQELGDREGITVSLLGLAGTLCAQKHHERAATLYGAAEALREAHFIALPPVQRTEYDRSISALRDAMGEEAFAKAWTLGRTLNLEQSMCYALEKASAA